MPEKKPAEPPTEPVDDRLRDPGFTPGLRHHDDLFRLMAEKDEDQAELAERSMARAGEPAARAALERLPEAVAPLRGRLARLVGRVAAETGGLVPELVGLLLDGDPKTRRNAILALGKTPGEGVEDALLAAWENETRVEMRRSLVASLGKVGGARSLALIKTVRSDDRELTRLTGQARLMLERTLSREDESRIRMDAVPPRPLSIALHVREGLEELLVSELPAEMGAQVVAPGVVLVRLSGPLSTLFAARTWTTMGIRLPAVPLREGDVATALAAALSGKVSRELLGALTEGPVRYRIAWDEGGHRRAEVWRAAADVAERAPELINDPTRSAWQTHASERGGALHVELEPRAYEDPRFAYRVRDVPAASHPTIAAALARLGGVKEDDVVWDPFAGSGLELIERARLGPYRELWGTDTDERALAALRANLASAGVTATTVNADARRHRVPGVTLVLTNPPMGRRVGTRDELGPLLDDFLANAASQLRPGGRLVWISAMAGTSRLAEKLGLRLTQKRSIDMGGFHAELQAFEKGGATRRIVSS